MHEQTHQAEPNAFAHMFSVLAADDFSVDMSTLPGEPGRVHLSPFHDDNEPADLD
jgi:hypothetical protein